MLPYDIIYKKRNGGVLSDEELGFFINGYVRGEIPDYQVAAFMMAVYFKGMTEEETTSLVRIMIDSGDRVDLSPIKGVKVDKHSTGGVADTTTLVLAPLVAAAGAPVAKMSGRGLGHTGGTIDKLESIPGFKVDLSPEEFIAQVDKIGIAVTGQSANLVPADKKLYALRDVTATIDSIPLIAGSIMSKKIAAGADAIVLDVKMGSGAFMADLPSAREMAKLMVKIGGLMNRRTIALITDMNQPLGTHIGNALEVKEAIEILKGMHKGSALAELSIILGANMLQMSGIASSLEEARNKIEKVLSSGEGLEKMRQMIDAQKGDPKVVDDLSRLPSARHKIEVTAKESGYICSYKTAQIGKCAQILGAGRVTKSDQINPAVGLILAKRLGDPVEKGETLAFIHADDTEKSKEASLLFLDSLAISEKKPEPAELVLDRFIENES